MNQKINVDWSLIEWFATFERMEGAHGRYKLIGVVQLLKRRFIIQQEIAFTEVFRYEIEGYDDLLKILEEMNELMVMAVGIPEATPNQTAPEPPIARYRDRWAPHCNEKDDIW